MRTAKPRPEGDGDVRCVPLGRYKVASATVPRRGERPVRAIGAKRTRSKPHRLNPGLRKRTTYLDGGGGGACGAAVRLVWSADDRRAVGARVLHQDVMLEHVGRLERLSARQAD